jgi:hypothetical protein
MASTTATPKPTDTTESDAATHSGTTQVKQALAQLREANSSGLENSPLGRLPPELRNEIFSLALNHSDSYELASDSNCMSSFFSRFGVGPPTTCSEISSALNILATCKQIRSETENLFFSLNDIKFPRYSLHYSVEQVKRISPLLKILPRSLGLDSGHIILPLQCSVRCYREIMGLDSQWSAGGLKHSFLTISQAIRPFQLLLDLDMAFHPWSASKDGEAWVCSQDTPLTMHECSHIRLKLQVGVNPKAALDQIDKVLDNKLEQLQQHRLHRLCPVRAMLRQFKKGLEDSRQYLRDINDFVSEFPDAV